MLWFSLWLIPIGLVSILVFPEYEKDLSHLIFLGAYFMVTFNVATRVIHAHSGLSFELFKIEKNTAL